MSVIFLPPAGTYCLAKHFAEKLVSEHHNTKGFPVAIVRPSIVGSLAQLPYPGYTGNVAGLTGIGVAFATGSYGTFLVMRPCVVSLSSYAVTYFDPRQGFTI